jgi:hypothetical protein
MKKMFTFTPGLVSLALVILFGGGSWAAGEKAPSLESIDSVIVKTLKAADQCIPQWKADKLVFCTGFSVSKSEIDKTFLVGSLANSSGDTDECLKAIKKAGYNVVFDNSAGKIPKAEWQDFQNSTEEALSFHQYHIVAFKKPHERLTCAHELIHVWQHSKAKDPLLAPVNRAKVAKSADVILTHELADVEKLEKSGKVEEALRRAKFAEDFINHLKSFNDLTNNLDEIEAHDFVFQNCEHLKCTDDDLETSVANLSARSSLLPAALQVEVENQIHNVVLLKRKRAIEQAKKVWKPLPDSVKSEAGGLHKLDWTALVKKIEEKGIRVVGLRGAGKPPLELGDKIPAAVFSSLGSPNDEETALIKDSKMLKGDAAGKFVCAGKGAIVLTEYASKETLVHEFLHFDQSQINPDYCPSVYGQEKIEADFHAGQMDRKTHDEKLLFAQAINALAEQDVYSALLANLEGAARLEKLNDQLMMKHYETWLSVEH